MTPSEVAQLEARPGEPLLDHLTAVAQLATRYAPRSLQREAQLAALVHDLGKATPPFQRYLYGHQPKGPATQHAYFGAVFGAWVAQQSDLDALIVFLAVARHHGQMRTPSELIPRKVDPPDFPTIQGSLRSSLKALAQQAEDIEPALPSLCHELALPDPEPFLNGEVWTTLETLNDEALDLADGLSVDRDRYWHASLLFSTLIDADKKQAAQVELPERPDPLPPDMVDQYCAKLSKNSELTPFREALYDGVNEKIVNASLDDLYPQSLTLSAPTGAGKTLTAFNAALKLQNRVCTQRGITPRIVYALPFINLIRQNEDVFRKVLQHTGVDPNDYLLAHHHLAPLTQEPPLDEEDTKALEDRLLLADAWDAEVVITTFVQVFHTLLGHRNKTLKKLHTLAEGAILILDEIQALPAEYWPLMRTVLSDLESLGVTVISMTATQPRLVEGLELAPYLEGYPSRVRIEREPPSSMEELADRFVDPPPHSQLIVVNTLRLSLQFYRALQERQVPHLHYLSTNLTPRDRGQTLESIRDQLSDGKPVTLVATQVVEAGIDLDFAEGWRELGPLESIIQVAGRINRNAKPTPSVLHVLELEEGQGNRVYGQILPDVTRKLLPSCTDQEALTHLETYFGEIEDRISQTRAHQFVQALDGLDYCRNVDCHGTQNQLPLCCFQLIEDLPAYRVFVEQDEEASDLLLELEEVLGMENLQQRRMRLKILQPQLENYTITPLASRVAANPPPPMFEKGSVDYLHVPTDMLDHFYDPQTGFRWMDDDLSEAWIA
ncbi:MAG: CRISPR-associated endonuclease Cas3'' [Salinibacter sp.]